MSSADVCAAILWLGVTLYAIFGGADFGAGMWDLLAGSGKRADRVRVQIDRSIGRSQKQCARIRCHQSGIERRFHTPAFHGSKIKAFCATLCRHRGSP